MNIDYHTKEFTYTLRPDHIIEINTHKDFDGNFTLEEVEENLRILDEVVGGTQKGFILHFPDKYVKKEVMKQYSEPPEHAVARAFLAKSFAAKLVGNLFLTLVQRLSKNKIPTKIFSEKEEAVEWLQIHLSEAKIGN